MDKTAEQLALEFPQLRADIEWCYECLFDICRGTHEKAVMSVPPRKDNFDMQMSAAFDELKAYRAAEEQGLLVRLPCKVGDRVYEVTWANKIIPHEIVSILLSQFHLRYNLANGESFRNVAIEREIFLTREEAEAALREGTT